MTFNFTGAERPRSGPSWRQKAGRNEQNRAGQNGAERGNFERLENSQKAQKGLFAKQGRPRAGQVSPRQLRPSWRRDTDPARSGVLASGPAAGPGPAPLRAAGGLLTAYNPDRVYDARIIIKALKTALEGSHGVRLRGHSKTRPEIPAGLA